MIDSLIIFFNKSVYSYFIIIIESYVWLNIGSLFVKTLFNPITSQFINLWDIIKS
jgi:hypothetical protein